MNIKRMLAYGVYYVVFGTLFFILEVGLIANLQKDWQFALATIIIFFIVVSPLMNIAKGKINKYLPRK